MSRSASLGPAGIGGLDLRSCHLHCPHGSCSRAHSSLVCRGDHSASPQRTGLPALRDAAAPGAGALQIRSYRGISRCCATAIGAGLVTLVTTTSATATGWARPRSPRCCAGVPTPGIEMATVYLLSTENLQRDPEELSCLIEIITDVVEEICAPTNRWSVRTVGDLELLGEEPARRLRDAVGQHRRPAAGIVSRQRRRRLRRAAGDRRRCAGAAEQGTGQRRDRLSR